MGRRLAQASLELGQAAVEVGVLAQVLDLAAGVAAGRAIAAERIGHPVQRPVEGDVGQIDGNLDRR